MVIDARADGTDGAALQAFRSAFDTNAPSAYHKIKLE